MAKALDNASFTASAGGLTDWTVAAAAPGSQTPAAAGAVDGETYRYAAFSADKSQWEIGDTVSATAGTVFARSVVRFNSSGTQVKINFATVPIVSIVPLAEDFRELMTAAKTINVDIGAGNDATGSGSAAAPYATLTKALVVAAALDTGASQLTISINGGTLTGRYDLPSMVGGLPPIITGVGSTTILQYTGGAQDALFETNGATPWIIQNMKVQTFGAGVMTAFFRAFGGGLIRLGAGIEFGLINGYCTWAGVGGSIKIEGNFTNTANCAAVLLAFGGNIVARGITGTVTGNPSISQYCLIVGPSFIDVLNATFSGACTGTRYGISNGGATFGTGGGASFFPGNAAGSSTTGYYG